ncbi:hypothetical protein HDU97_010207 [Phlyctochytrium planicorne]|nr:hypothetical protein HDU97_010207 [Phlyctochytrium planicorne]
MLFKSSSLLLAALAMMPAAFAADSSTAAASDDPGVTGNCLSGTYPFNPDRIYTVPAGKVAAGAHYPPGFPDMDWAGFDYTLDYAPANANPQNETLGIKVTKLPDGAIGGVGTRLSTTRYYLYGRFTIKMKAIPVKGMVTSFITMSSIGDEIDWEIINPDGGSPATTNVFYQRIPQFGLRNKAHDYPSGTSGDLHEYVIDWNRERIQWLIDGQVVREYKKSDSLYTGPDPGHNKEFYPSTPSMIQLGAWDAGDSPNAGTSDWAGGKVPWGSNTFFEATFYPLKVECYDDKDKVVPMWPIAGNKQNTKAPKPTTTAVAPTSPLEPAPFREPKAFSTVNPGVSNNNAASSPTARVALGNNKTPSGAISNSGSLYLAAFASLSAGILGIFLL